MLKVELHTPLLTNSNSAPSRSLRNNPSARVTDAPLNILIRWLGSRVVPDMVIRPVISNCLLESHFHC
jgi:hypothetical protein